MPQCPLCASSQGKILSESHNFILCECGSIYNIEHRFLKYNDDYFIKDYQKQYGKTYVEDFDNLYQMANKRLKIINSLLAKKEKKSLLDIGAALGFFLKAAKDLGYQNVQGVEVSAYASKYCAEKFHFPISNQSFVDFQFTQKYTVITAWYFLEHCSDTAETLQKITANLEDGGVLAFSMPSVYGPLFRKNLSLWIKTHPVDHRLDITPRAMKKFLLKQGFSKVKIKPAGIHPQRYQKTLAKSKLFCFLYKIFSFLLKYSDTVEIYAKK